MSASLNIVADQQITLASEFFSGLGELRLVNGRDIRPNQLKDTDILLVRSVTRVNADLLADSRVRFVGSATAGIDHIDLHYLRSHHIEFAYAPGSNARAVAEYVLACLLELAQRGGFALTGKTIGIIGVGQVGSRVQTIMDAMGVRCLLNDPPRSQTDANEPWSDLAELYDADIITCHVPLTKEGAYPTANLIDNRFLQRLKPDVIFINTSRGGVVNERDLLKFIDTCPEAKVVLDVWLNEPDINQDLLHKVDIATAHIAGYSFDGKLKATRQLSRALATFLQQDIHFMEQVVDTEPVYVNLDGGDDMVYQALQHSYNIVEDSRLLKQALMLPEVDRGPYFDSLRKNYPVRREFSHLIINADSLLATDKTRLQSIGFTLE